MEQSYPAELRTGIKKCFKTITGSSLLYTGVLWCAVGWEGSKTESVIDQVLPVGYFIHLPDRL